MRVLLLLLLPPLLLLLLPQLLLRLPAAAAAAGEDGGGEGSMRTAEMFSFIDTDQDDALQRSEVNAFLERVRQTFVAQSGGDMDEEELHGRVKEMLALFEAMDYNDDGEIVLREFLGMKQALDDVEDDEEVEYIDRHGNMQRMRAGDMQRRIDEQRKKMKVDEHGRLTHSAEGSVAMDDIGESHPSLARFVALGQWVLGELQQLGEAHGALVGVASSPREAELEETAETGGENAGVHNTQKGDSGGGGSDNDEEDEEEPQPRTGFVPHASTFETLMLLKVQSNVTGQREFYEVHVERDPHKYRRPFFAMLRAWQVSGAGIDSERLRKIELPPPQLATFQEKYMRAMINISIIVLLLIGVYYFRIGVKAILRPYIGPKSGANAASHAHAHDHDHGHCHGHDHPLDPSGPSQQGSNSNVRRRRGKH